MLLLPARAHKFARDWTSDYTGIRTSHVFRPGIERGSTAWKSRAVTTQSATHIMVMASSFKNIVLSFFAVFKDYVLIYFNPPHFESRVILKHIGIVVLPISLIYFLFIPINYTPLSLQFISTQKML